MAGSAPTTAQTAVLNLSNMKTSGPGGLNSLAVVGGGLVIFGAGLNFLFKVPTTRGRGRSSCVRGGGHDPFLILLPFPFFLLFFLFLPVLRRKRKKFVQFRHLPLTPPPFTPCAVGRSSP